MKTIKINNKLNEKLNKIALLTNKSKNNLIKQILENYISEIKFLLETQKRYNDPNAEYINYDEFKNLFPYKITKKTFEDTDKKINITKCKNSKNLFKKLDI
jgi:predicted DNA-binding protein